MNTQVDTTTVEQTKQVAKHSLLATDGSVVEEFEDGTGIRYQDVETGQTFDYQLLANTDATRMLALFGARTLATNVASGVRNNSKLKGTSDADGAAQMDAIRERFALIHGTDGNGGQWIDRTREGGPRLDPNLMADAVIAVMVAAGKFDPGEADARKAKLLEKWAADPKLVGQAHQVPQVRDEYTRRSGKTARSVDDLAGMLA